MIIPAILVKSQKEFQEKIKKIAPYASIIQIDMMDGAFVPNTTWADVDIIEHLHLPMRFEAHLMVENPERGTIEEWAEAGAFRIIFHIEATRKPEECIRQIKKFKCEAGIAINPKTSLEKIKKFLPKIDYVLVMGVDPGFSGQKFQPAALQKIKQIRAIAPRVLISVDGGVDKTSAKKLYSAGADYLCAASSIFKSKNIRKAIEELENE